VAPSFDGRAESVPADVAVASLELTATGAVPDEARRTRRDKTAPKEARFMGQLVQILGALLILAAFVLAQLGVLDQRSDRYLVANLVGASVLALDAWLESQLGFFVLEAAWAIVAGWALARRGRRNPAQSSSTSTNAKS
jgi:hypothetical protein